MVKDVIQSRHLKGAAYPGFSGWVINAITCILIGRTHRGGDTQTEKEEAVRRQRQRLEAVKSQGVQPASRGRKGQGRTLPGGFGGSVNWLTP